MISRTLASAAVAAGLLAQVHTQVQAQAATTPAGAATLTSDGKPAQAPSASSSATTTAPVSPGSARMHTVQTPKVSDRTTMTGGNTNGGAN